MGHILVPTDFSSNASKALEFAINLSTQKGDDITVFHAFKSKIDLSDVDIEIESPQAKMEKLLSNYSQQKLFGLLKDGEVLEVVEEMTATGLYSLVVMGTKGANGIAEHLFGSITSQAIEKVMVPLLVIPQNTHCKPIKKIGFAFSFALEDIEVLEVFRNFALEFDANLVCFHVAYDKKEKVDAESRLALLQEKFWDTPIDRLSFEVVVNEDIEDGINSFIANEGIDVLGLVPLKRGFWDGLLKPSMSKKLTHHSHIPLLIIKA